MPVDPTVWHAFAARAAEAPDRTAVGGAVELTYAALTDRVVDLSARIGAVAAPGSLVALEADTATAGVVAMLGAARAGCALLPLTADSPPHHRELVLRDARATALVRATAEDRLEVIALGEGRVDLAGAAYVLYTSGSTGRPKGVVVSHEALVTRLRGLAERPGLVAGGSMLAMTALSFDISVAETMLPVTVGATVVAAPYGSRIDPTVFGAAVDRYAPSVIQATPSFLRLAVAGGWKGTATGRIWCGGEALTPELARALLPRCASLWNMYGPTEATIWASVARVTDGDRIALGTPLRGSGMCLATSDGTPPDDGAGEILLYGAGLAVGYLDRPELTAERFRVEDTPDGPLRCYRTGDRGRYRDDGSLEFLGRTDAQVKLRGHRIELGEIEAVLEECPGVSEATVVVRSPDDPARAHLAAFAVVVGDGVTTTDVRRWLADRLPAVMRPARVTLVDALPRTTAGKVDRVLLAVG